MSNDDFSYFLTMFKGGMLLVLLLCFLSYFPPKWECDNVGQVSAIPTRFEWPIGGCYVKSNGKWVPLKTWRTVEE